VETGILAYKRAQKKVQAMCSAPQQDQLRDASVQHPDASKRPTRTAALLRPLAMLLSLSASLALSLLRIAAAAVRLAARAALGLRDPADSACACEFYEGVVHHLRTKPKRHSLTYRVRYCLVDLDAARPPACCAAQLEDRLTAAQARSESGYDGKVLLLLLPGSAGFEENPIVVYYCHDAAGALRCCLAEVTNTPWGDRVRFAFAPSGDELPKAMHVSPLQDGTRVGRCHTRPRR